MKKENKTIKNENKIIQRWKNKTIQRWKNKWYKDKIRKDDIMMKNKMI